jgi:hypothetical protein
MVGLEREPPENQREWPCMYSCHNISYQTFFLFGELRDCYDRRPQESLRILSMMGPGSRNKAYSSSSRYPPFIS